MKKHLLGTFLLITAFCFKSFAQQPAVLNSYTYTLGPQYMNFDMYYTANDTGTVLVNIQLASGGTGNITYDNTFHVSADSAHATLHLSPLYVCTDYNLLFTISNAHVTGVVQNPLFSFTSSCVAAGIAQINADNFMLRVLNHAVELTCTEMPQNAVAEIYDITGRKISSAIITNNTQQIPVNANTGVYLLKVTGSDQSLYTTRFITN